MTKHWPSRNHGTQRLPHDMSTSSPTTPKIRPPSLMSTLLVPPQFPIGYQDCVPYQDLQNPYMTSCPIGVPHLPNDVPYQAISCAASSSFHSGAIEMQPALEQKADSTKNFTKSTKDSGKSSKDATEDGNSDKVRKETKAKLRAEERERRKRESKAKTLGELVSLAVKNGKIDNEDSDSMKNEESKPIPDNLEEHTLNQEHPALVDHTDVLYQDDVPQLSETDFLEEVDLEGPCCNEPTILRRELLSARPLGDLTNYYKENDMGFATEEHRMRIQNFGSNVVEYIKDEKKKHAVVPWVPSPSLHSMCKCSQQDDALSDSEDDENSKNGEGQVAAIKDLLQKEVARKQSHPSALHSLICFNEKGLGNDGPICRCAARSREEGIRHNAFLGERSIPKCNPYSNNSGRLYHYVLRVDPSVNSSGTRKSNIQWGEDTYTFEGYSVFFHRPLPDIIPRMPISNIADDIDFEFVEEPFIGSFVVSELELFAEYILDGLMELYDTSRFPFIKGQDIPKADECPIYHFMPRYTKRQGNEKALLPMSAVLDHLNSSFRPVTSVPQAILRSLPGQILCCPQTKPSALRVDALSQGPDGSPLIVHYSTKPAAYINSKSPELGKLCKKLKKMRHVASNNGDPTLEEIAKIDELESQINMLKKNEETSRFTTVRLPVNIFYLTGLLADITNHTFVLLLAIHHARYHWSLQLLEERISYSFKNRGLLELALTHPSFKNNYGTVLDHAKNSLSNLGFKRRATNTQPNQQKRKRGYKQLRLVMNNDVRESARLVIPHNERLEFLGDAVVGLIASYRLFFLMKSHNEGGLATYRSCLVQNRNLANLSKNIGLRNWLLFFHGPELCHEKEFRHALANAFEAIMAAIYLDSDVTVCDRIFSDAMYGADPEWKAKWDMLPEHELKAEHPGGDRHLILTCPALQKLVDLEESIGVKFTHIRVLAKALTRKCQPLNELTKGNNQRMEWLGDSILQLLVSDYLYRHFPHFHEGHLSLLRTCVVSNKTQSVICDDLDLTKFLVNFSKPKSHKLKVKDKADLVESLIGALLVDRGLEYCRRFVKVCFIPRLKHFVSGNRWIDAKSELQQKCLAFRSATSRKPQTPIYKLLEVAQDKSEYLIGVYFRDKCLGRGRASTKLMAEMIAAKNALSTCKEILPTNLKNSINQRISMADPTVETLGNAKRTKLSSDAAPPVPGCHQTSVSAPRPLMCPMTTPYPNAHPYFNAKNVPVNYYENLDLSSNFNKCSGPHSANNLYKNIPYNRGYGGKSYNIRRNNHGAGK